MAKVPSVEQWLSGKNICITGVTGFIGRVLLEKLMRCCPTHGNIYLFIRSKKGKTAKDRYDEIVNCDLFTFAKVTYNFEKLIVVPTDFSEAGLGLTDEIKTTLKNNVNIVFHVAASIKFNEPLCDAIKINTRITKDMIDLAKGMKNLEAFTQVSTAYVNSDRDDIGEVVYPPKLDWRKAIELAESAEPNQVDAVTAKALGGTPNTYCFTKYMGEHVVWDHRHELPVLIYRPVIVMNLKYEPEPGWTNNFSGPEMIAMGIGKGILRVTHFHGTHRLSYCPGDITVNGLIVATWKLACHSKITKEPCDQVINSNHVKKNIDEAVENSRKVMEENPLTDVVWKAYYFPINNDLLFYLGHIFINLLPNIIFQFGIKIFLKKDVPLIKIMRKFYIISTDLFRFFTANELNMRFDNYNKLEEALSESDKKRFYMRLRQEDPLTSNVEIQRVIHLTSDHYVPLEKRMKHQARIEMADKIFRYTVMGLFVAFFPYNYVYNIITCTVNYFLSPFYYG